MRYISALAVAALAFVFGGSATPAAAQQAPSGSYQQTCRNVGVRGSTLYAECQNTGGGWQTTQLRDFDRCNGEIQNINGSLQCAGGSGGYGNGGYGRDSDRDRGRDDNYNRNRDADNDHDRDRDRGYGNNGVPYGSYSQTCQNIRVSGNTLQASCQKKNGKLKNTSLHNFSQCRDIENDNGKLRCR
jgi:CVNH domain